MRETFIASRRFVFSYHLFPPLVYKNNNHHKPSAHRDSSCSQPLQRGKKWKGSTLERRVRDTQKGRVRRRGRGGKNEQTQLMPFWGRAKTEYKTNEREGHTHTSKQRVGRKKRSQRS